MSTKQEGILRDEARSMPCAPGVTFRIEKMAAILVFLTLGACGQDLADDLPGETSIDPADTQHMPPPAPPASRTAALAQALAAQSYDVKLGEMRQFGVGDCEAAIDAFHNCFGNNPAAPYLMPVVPLGPGESLDPAYGDTWKSASGQASSVVRLRKDEAVVLIGHTPPRGAYFGYQPYVFTREGEPGGNAFASLVNGLAGDLADVLYQESPNPDRFMLFASITNSVNNAVIASSLADEPWGQEVALVATPDKDLMQLIKQDLVASGLGEDRVFAQPIPDTMQLGLQDAADDFLFVMRYALPQNPDDGDSWRGSMPFDVMRVTPISEKVNVAQFPAAELEDRGGSFEDEYLLPLKKLDDEVRERLAVPFAAKTDSFFSSELANVNGPACLVNHMNCLGETQDNASYRISAGYQVDGNDVIIVMGVNHTKTQNATYVSLSMMNSDTFTGLGAVSQTGDAAGFVEGDLSDSVEDLLNATGGMQGVPLLLKNHMSELYVRLMARDCSGLPVCSPIPGEGEVALPLDGTFKIMKRAYLRPGAQRSAAPSRLLSPRSILWQRP